VNVNHSNKTRHKTNHVTEMISIIYSNNQRHNDVT